MCIRLAIRKRTNIFFQIVDLFNTCLVNTVFLELDGPETIIDQECLNRVSNSTSIIEIEQRRYKAFIIIYSCKHVVISL